MDQLGIELASGSVIGRDHRLVFKNYQDGCHIHQSPWYAIAIVTDGCGKCSHSEVGAQLGAALFGECLRREVEYRKSSRLNWERILQDTLSALNVLTVQLGGNFRQRVEDYFLFTLVGALLIAGECATFFAIGDGVVVVNGEIITLGPFPENQPPYAGYGLLKGSVSLPEGQSLSISSVRTMALSDLNTFVIGCDGVGDLIRVADKNLPGIDEQVGHISQFWEDDRYFSGNTDLVSRRLRLIGRDWPKKDPRPGLLPDDTTMVVGRRKPTTPNEEE